MDQHSYDPASASGDFEEERPYDDEEVDEANMGDEVPSQAGEGGEVPLFDTPEDAIQTLIAYASLPVDYEVQSVPLPTLLARLSLEPRAKTIAEYRDPPLAPHPASTLLLIKKRLHDEYRHKKMVLRAKYVEEEQAQQEEHERIRSEMLEAHRAELQAIADLEVANAPAMPVPTARSIQVLEKQLIQTTTEPIDAGTRRLAAFWKSKYEKTCAELVVESERLSVATQEFTHLSQLNGRDPSYLEKALAALRDGEIEEQVRGDSIKQQFLLECRRRGLTPEEVQTKKPAAVTKRSLKADAPHANAAADGSIEVPAGEGEGSLYLLPEDTSYVECFSEKGYRVPAVRDVGLRIEALRKEIEVADITAEYLKEPVDQLAFDLDTIQTRYSQFAGSMAFDEELPEIEESIRRWSEQEESDLAAYQSLMWDCDEQRILTKSATARAAAVGKSQVKSKRLQNALNAQRRELDVEYAQQKLLVNIDNEGERAHLRYLNAQLTSMGAEKKLLAQELFEVERKAKGIATELEAKLSATDFDLAQYLRASSDRIKK